MTRKWLFASVVLLAILLILLERREKSKKANGAPHALAPSTKEVLWAAPDTSNIPDNDSGELIRYGKKLISHTSRYIGPEGSLYKNANGMNCQNCHLEAGTRAWAGNFGAVASLYPRFGDRRNSKETIDQRITDCFERSMNGRAPDSNSREMRAMNAYISWVGKDVSKGKKPPGTGLEIPAFMERPADPQKGKIVYQQKCRSCHGSNGEGQPDSLSEYRYPPLWGEHSYNTSAGLYRLSKFAGFVKDNMPYGSNYSNEQLTTEEAWDLAAFVNSQPRPVKKFRQDWPNILLKPVDLEDGPFPDSFPSIQHKYGPFGPIAKARKNTVAK
jgi:thiosulfate dehydrogenase